MLFEFNPTFDPDTMQVYDIFFNPTNRLRSGWRASIYVFFVIVLAFVSGAFLTLLRPLAFHKPWIGGLLEVLSWVVLLGITVLAGWGCGRLLEDLPWRALGWSLHKGAIRDLLVGCIVGSASLMIATFIATALGGLRFSFYEAGALFAVGKTLLVSAFIFVIAAAAEESLFRGYALQTFTRAGLIWVGVAVTSVPFALIHSKNPNVVAGFTFINTSLAGVWLAAAYLRTRSLWFPFGIHCAWNWTMGAVFGIPVSGITTLTPNPLLRASDLGPAWLTGGAYGLEGGAACTIALVVSIVFIWRTKLISATDEMRELTSHEIPNKAHVEGSPGLQNHTGNTNQPPASD